MFSTNRLVLGAGTLLVLIGGLGCQPEERTADSEFFVNIADNPALDTGNTMRQPDGQGYATFGRVVRGMEILEEIQDRPTITDAGSEVLRGQMLEQAVPIRSARVLGDRRARRASSL